MLKRNLVILGFLILAFAGILGWYWSKKTAVSRVIFAYVNRENLPSAVKSASDFEDKLHNAAAAVAAKQHYALVLDKKIVVSGAVDITNQVAAGLQGKPFRGILSKNLSSNTVGVVDHEALMDLPELVEARKKYQQFFSSLKKEYQKKSGGLSPGAKEELMQGYSEQLSQAQKQFVEPIFDRLEKTIHQVAKDKKLACVLSREDVLYGGVDITRDVLHRATSGEALSGKEAPVSIAVVDVSKLMPVHPLSMRLKELDREIDAWKSGRYGIAMTLLNPEERHEWEVAQAEAHKNWENHLNEFIKDEHVFESSLPKSGGGQTLSPEKLKTIQVSLDQAYKEDLATKMDGLEKGYQDQVKEAQQESEKSIEAYGADLLKFRNQRLSARQTELLGKLERDVRNEESKMEEEYLQFEKKLMNTDQEQKLELQLKLQVASASDKPDIESQLDAIEKHEGDIKNAKRSELGKKLSMFQDQGLSKVHETLKQLAAELDKEAFDKIKDRREEIFNASREALLDEQNSLRSQLSALKTEAAKDAEKKVGSRFGVLQTLAVAHQAELNQKMQAIRLGIETKLAEQEKKILAESKDYVKVENAIQAGNHTIIDKVIADLIAEQKSIDTAIRSDILAEAASRGKEEGYKNRS